MPRGSRAIVVTAAAALGAAIVVPVAVYAASASDEAEWWWLLASPIAGGIASAALFASDHRTQRRQGAKKDRRDTGRELAAVARNLAPFACAVLGCLVVFEFSRELHRDTSRAWTRAALVVGAIATGVLLARALVGDRSRGRRRCPKCWYDMSAAAGLVCPECGKDAKREGRLFKARRRKCLIALSLLPLAAGGAVKIGWYLNEVGWARAIPTPVLIALSPWLEFGDEMEQVLSGEMSWIDRYPLPAWQVAMAKRVSHHTIRTSNVPEHLVLHAWYLACMHDADEETSDALLRLVNDPNPTIVKTAADVLGSMRPSAAIEDALTGLVENPTSSFAVRSAAMRSLWIVKRTLTGGPAPAQVLADATASTPASHQATACRVLGLCDASAASKAALRGAAARTSDPWVRTCAVGALAKIAPADESVRSAAVEVLTGEAFEEFTGFFVSDVLEFERHAVDAGTFVPDESVLANPSVRAAMIKRANSTALSEDWAAMQRFLLRHPCLTEQERSRVRIEETAEAAVQGPRSNGAPK